MLDVLLIAPWLVLLSYGLLIWLVMPSGITSTQFFSGSSKGGTEPSLVLLTASAAISWIFAKSITNVADLSAAYGWIGAIGYAAYYLCFIIVGVTIYFIRTRGGWVSLSSFLTHKYGVICTKLFMVAIAIRLINEIWSNTKVGALYFGIEGSSGYWIAVIVITGFTLFYSWRGGLRSSLVTDGAQMLLAAVLLVVVLSTLGPGLFAAGLPRVNNSTMLAGSTFFCLALVQALSYGFHDPVMTDRAFITSPKRMIKGFFLAGLVAGSFILLFSIIGIYSRSQGLDGVAVVVVPGVFGLPMLLVFNAIMLTSAGSTLDSTFASAAKLGARDWTNNQEPPTDKNLTLSRHLMLALALLGNLPLLSIYLGDALGPAVIAATTISGTMVMGLAPIFLLSWIRTAGQLSFHLAFWPGLFFGVLLTLESAFNIQVFPAALDIGAGKYADDLGVNVYGLVICTGGFLLGAMVSKRDTRAREISA